MDERQRLCAACESPSPGPAKRLYYQQRNYGPFFPILEGQRRRSNMSLFSAGRVVVCTGCASHLLRQWSSYEQKWTPVEKRIYSLRSDEREAHRAKQNNLSSQVRMQGSRGLSKETTPTRQPFQQAKKTESQNPTKVLSTENMDDRIPSQSNDALSPSFITEGNSPFRRAVNQVSKQKTRALNESSKISDVYEAVVRERKGSQPSNEIVSVEKDRASSQTRSSALWNLPSEDIRSKVREELQENIEVMIRKLAEIQHLENMRRYEQELKEAAQRICRAQNREGDIDRTVQNLKKQLQEELMFRDTSRVLRDNNDENIIPPSNPGIEPKELNTTVGLAANGIESVTAAKKVGTTWNKKAKRERYKPRKASYEVRPPERRVAPLALRSYSETIPRDVARERQKPPRSAHRLDAVLRELEQEREWRKKTENEMLRQREMIEDLRKGIQDDVKRLIDEQTRRYQDLKDTLIAYEKAKTVSSPAGSVNNHHQPLVDRERTRPTLSGPKISREEENEQSLRSGTWLYEDFPQAAVHSRHGRDDDDDDDDHSDDGDDDHNDDRTDDDSVDDDDDDSSPPHTPEFYIH